MQLHFLVGIDVTLCVNCLLTPLLHIANDGLLCRHMKQIT